MDLEHQLRNVHLKFSKFRQYHSTMISLFVSMTTRAPQLRIGLSFPPYDTLLGPSISTEWQYVFFHPYFIVITGSFNPCFLFDLILC